MKTYTKEQLLEAQAKWNQDMIDNPENYKGEVDYSDPTLAERQIEHLLKFVEE